MGRSTNSLSPTVPGGIDLRIEQLRRQMVSDIPDILTDLLEIAAYVYAADSKVRRGGRYMQHVGARLAAPISSSRSPSEIQSCGHRRRSETRWSKRSGSFLMTATTSASRSTASPGPGRVISSLGMKARAGASFPTRSSCSPAGSNSFAGVLTEIEGGGHRVALVSHRSSPKMLADQTKLLKALEAKSGGGICGMCRFA